MAEVHAEYEPWQEPWLIKTGCADIPLSEFFPNTSYEATDRAKAACISCPVRLDCLEHAYRLHITAGYFGGLSPATRKAFSYEEAIEVEPAQPSPRTIAQPTLFDPTQGEE